MEQLPYPNNIYIPKTKTTFNQKDRAYKLALSFYLDIDALSKLSLRARRIREWLFSWQGQKGSEHNSNRLAVGGWFLHYHTTPTKKQRDGTKPSLCFLAGAEGLEPTTHGFGDRYSTN